MTPAKHALSDVEGGAKAGNGTTMNIITGGNGDNRDEFKKIRFLCSLLFNQQSWRLGAKRFLEVVLSNISSERIYE